METEFLWFVLCYSLLRIVSSNRLTSANGMELRITYLRCVHVTTVAVEK